MNPYTEDAIRAEVEYRLERARASWPKSGTTAPGTVPRLWRAFRRWWQLRAVASSGPVDSIRSLGPRTEVLLTKGPIKTY